MNKIRIIAAVLIINFFYTLSNAEKPKIKFREFNTSHGLSKSSVFAICQDNDGVLWIGNYNGLSTYNGYEFKNFYYDPDNSNSLAFNFISALFADRYNQIWIGTRSGICVYNKDTKTFRGDENDVKFAKYDPVIWDIKPDKKGNLYFATNRGILIYNYNADSFDETYYNHEQLQLLDIRTIYFRSSSNLLMGTVEGLYSLNLNNNIVRKINIPNSNFNDALIQKIYKDEKGKIWIGSENGLEYFIEDNKERIEDVDFVKIHLRRIVNNSRIPISVSSITEGINMLWVGSSYGLFLFDYQDNTWHHFKQEITNRNSLSDNNILSLFVDHQNNLWVGNMHRGVDQLILDYYPFSNYTYIPYAPNCLKASFIRSMCSDKYDNIWIGSVTAGLHRFDANKKVFTQFFHPNGNTNGYKFRNIITLFPEGDSLWIGTYNLGVFIYHQKTGMFTKLKPPIKNFDNEVSYIYKDSKAIIWIGTKNFLYKYNKKENHIKIVDFDYTVKAMVEDYRGDIWILTAEGIFKLNPEYDNIEKYDIIDNYKIENFAKCIITDNDSNLWIGTMANGIYKYHLSTKRIINYSNKTGQKGNAVISLQFDSAGYLWFGTNHGLSCLNVHDSTITNYDNSHGLDIIDFWSNGYAKLSDENLAFGGTNGFIIFNPNQIIKNPFKPKVLITDMLIFNKPVDIPENKSIHSYIESKRKILLNHKQSSISFKYLAINYIIPEKNNYAYRLKGFDKQGKWNYVDNSRMATYTNLQPGEYTFMVRASNSDGAWNEQGAKLSFYIKPPWWQTKIFKVVFVLMVILGITIYIQLRLRYYRRERNVLEKKINERTAELKQQKEALEKAYIKIKELDSYKTTFFQNITHEIRTPVTLILGNIRAVLESDRNEPVDRFMNKIEIARRNTNRILLLINQILDLSRLDKGKLKLQSGDFDIIQHTKMCVAAYESLAKSKDIELLFEANTESLIIISDITKYEWILFNLLSNALKFTDSEGKIEVNINLLSRKDKEALIEISVSDTGAGISETDIPFIFDRFRQVNQKKENYQPGTGIGLAIVKEYVDLLNGSISVTSKINEGTTFKIKLSLPLSQNVSMEKELSVNIQPTDYLDEQIHSYILHDAKKQKVKMLSNIIRSPGEKKYKILIVEDNDDLRKYIIGIIESDYEIIEAQNGKVGLELTKEFIPDIIITDIMMPEMDGLEMCKKIRSNEELMHIPIIIVSAKVSDEEVIKSLNIGVNEYLYKPFNPDILKFKIANLLNFRYCIQAIANTSNSKFNLQNNPNFQHNSFIYQVIKIINEHIDDSDLSVKNIAESLNYSPSQLTRKVQDIVKLSPGELMKIVRLEHAVNLLKNHLDNNLTIAEISFLTGFKDPSHFSKAFKNQFGITPKEYAQKSS